MCLKMTKFYIFTRQLAIHVVFIFFNIYQIIRLECFRCKVEFNVICRQPCPSYCRECKSEDLCLTCMLPESRFTDTGSFLCASSCENQCLLERTCLKECSILRDMFQSRPALCVTNETCFQCLNLSGKCLQCNTGRYSSFCEKKCGHCQSDFNGRVNCDTRTGNCKGECENGYFGQRCDKECRNCLSIVHTNRCEQITGKCMNGCLPGWFYDTCNESCSKNCLKGTCNQNNGYCVEGCIAGCYGSKCERNCNDNCIQRSCDQFKGHCTYGCKPGWFGETCRSPCSDKCLQRACHKSSGNCTYGCLPGWFGDTCEMSCSDSCFNKSCDQSSGMCDFGCIYGFYGVRCNEWGYVSTINITRLDEYNHDHGTVNNSDSARVIYAVVGTIAGVFVTRLCYIIIMSVRKAILSFKRYDYLSNSLRRNTSPIYDEITQTNADNQELNAISGTVTVGRISSNADASTLRDHADYEEISFNSEICLDEDHDKVYYLHPIN